MWLTLHLPPPPDGGWGLIKPNRTGSQWRSTSKIPCPTQLCPSSQCRWWRVNSKVTSAKLSLRQTAAAAAAAASSIMSADNLSNRVQTENMCLVARGLPPLLPPLLLLLLLWIVYFTCPYMSVWYYCFSKKKFPNIFPSSSPLSFSSLMRLRFYHHFYQRQVSKMLGSLLLFDVVGCCAAKKKKNNFPPKNDLITVFH